MSNLVLPGNPRYQPKSLKPIFGYDNLMRPIGEIEIATMRVLGDIGVIQKEELTVLTPDVVQRILDIPTTDVDDLERRVTQHDIRAWVQIAQGIVGPKLGRWMHVPLTSYDAISTGQSLLFLRAHQQVILPRSIELVRLFMENIKRSAEALMIGRTHGQHALPITVGFWLATILARFLYNLGMMDMFSRQLVGKIAGAVGPHNAQVGLEFNKRCKEHPLPDFGENTFENRVLRELGLRSGPISTQIPIPEPLAYYLHSVLLTSGSLAQFGEDGRHLMRTEIGELTEPFEAGKVGSSTMAHKRNPIFLEKLVGMFLKNTAEYQKVIATLISEHQRDLVGSSLMRDFPILVVNLVEQLETLLRPNKAGVPYLSRLTVNEEACRRNFDMSAHLILAEPIYIALQMAGYEGDAHNLVSHQAVPIAQSRRIQLIDAVEELAAGEEKLAQAVSRIPAELMTLLRRPERYIGDAPEATLRIVAWGEERVKAFAA